MEIILCAAIHYRDKKKYSAGPLNIESGLVVCGRRHHDCWDILKQVTGFDENLVNPDFGFLTSENRFLTRKEAWLVAKAANQVKGPNRDDEINILTSEDLYWGFDK